MNVDPLAGPRLKLARAKRHLIDFKETVAAFRQSEPHEVTVEQNANTGENVYRIRVKACLPAELSVIVGDVVHNLRSALDQLVCGLVRANRKQVRTGNGFPISGSVKGFDKACTGRLKNVSGKADRFIRRLRPYKGGNEAFWLLSELDNLDKHNSIVPVLLGEAKTHVRIGIPFIGISPDGGLAIGGSPDGFEPLGFHHGFGVPEGSKPFRLEDGCEIYRSTPRLHLVEEVGFVAQITFGKTAVTNDELIGETLVSLINLVERVLNIVERRIL
jgi:hypothetical protein